VSRSVIEEGTHNIDGMDRIEGTVRGETLDVYDLIHCNAPLTLALEDGRTCDCWLPDDSGTLVGRGGRKLYRV